jgi:hypothetical protein
MPRNIRLAAEDEARAVLAEAIAGYKALADYETMEGYRVSLAENAADERVLAALNELAGRIKGPRRCDPEDMRTAHGFARLVAIYAAPGTYLVSLLVHCRIIHDRKIKRTIDISSLLADLQIPGRWSSSHRARLEAYVYEQQKADFVSRFFPCGPREALATFVSALERHGPCRPADLARVAGLVLSDTNIRRLQRPKRRGLERPLTAVPLPADAVEKVENRTTPKISQMVIFGLPRRCDAL